jgi:hypothetical protein
MIPLTGSLVVLDFARFIPLPSEYDAPVLSDNIIYRLLQMLKINTKTRGVPLIMNWWFLQFLLVCSSVKEVAQARYIGMLIKEDVVQTAAEPDFITHSHARKLVGVVHFWAST